MNMPEVDKYGTVGPHTLIRQHMDYGHWYDRTKLSQKDIHNVQYTACMNPTAGSFTINPRLERVDLHISLGSHFCQAAPLQGCSGTSPHSPLSSLVLTPSSLSTTPFSGQNCSK